MPTTRHAYDGFGWNHATGNQGLVTRPLPVERGTWEPTITEAEDPIGFGMEVFARKRMPDGAPVSLEGRRYIAAVIMNDLRKGE